MGESGTEGRRGESKGGRKGESGTDQEEGVNY